MPIAHNDDPVQQFAEEFERTAAVLRTLMQVGYHGRLEISFQHGHPGIGRLDQTFKFGEVDPASPLAGLLGK